MMPTKAHTTASARVKTWRGMFSGCPASMDTLQLNESNIPGKYELLTMGSVCLRSENQMMCAGITEMISPAASQTTMVLENSRFRKSRSPGVDISSWLVGTMICRPAARTGWEKS